MNDQSSTPRSDTSDIFHERVFYDVCPLCGEAEIIEDKQVNCSRHPSWIPPLSPVMTWMRCNACGHGFTNGYFTDAALSLVFRNIQANQRPGDDIEGNRQLSARIVEKVLPYKNSGVWLDVGFGNGSLLFTAQEYGFEAIGFDLRQEAVKEMRSLGFDAYCQDICIAEGYGSADVISMADVLEHTPFPKAVLAAAHKQLNHDGILFLSMPNAEAFLWQNMTQKKINPYWAELEHYHNFSRSRLYILLEEIGFTPKVFGISQRYRCGMEIIAQKIS